MQRTIRFPFHPAGLAAAVIGLTFATAAWSQAADPAVPVVPAPAVPAVPAPAAPVLPKAAAPAAAPVLPKATATAPVLPKATEAVPPAAAPAAPGTGALIPPPAAPAAPVITGGAVPAPTAPATPKVDAAAKAKRKIAPPAPPRETALSTDPNPSLTPETFFATAKASERYAAIADAGGWPVVEAVSPGAKGKAVATLRLRLAIEGDLSTRGRAGAAVTAEDPPSLFDTRWTPDLTEAVKRYQSRLGLRETGVVAGATLKAMNVPARVRFTELASSAQRLAGRTFTFADRYVAVNLPSASVEAVENGQVVHRYVAIVGDPEHASPEVDARVVGVNLNPTWTVPTSIIKNEIIPKMQKDPGYLDRARIRILDNTGNVVNPGSINWNTQRATNYTLRQDSGKANSLGSIRINMPNKFAVYMHDTPSKRLFAADDRFLSHGCVRVQGVNDLAAWLLKDSLGAPDGLWTAEGITDRIAEGEHVEIKLNRPVPVAWVYMTGWANGDGIAHFRDDVYGIDTVGAAAEASVDPKLLPAQR